MATNKSTKSAKKSDSKIAPKELESKINIPIAEASASPDDKAILEQMEADWLKRKQEEQRAEEEIQAGNKILLADASNSSTVVDAAATDCNAQYQEPDASGKKDKHDSKDDHNKACGITENVNNYGMLAAIIGGVGIAAAAAGGGGGGGGGTPVVEGTVIDGPVANALVFRDTDGDGKWLDVDGDGRWDSGDEYIVATDADGDYRNLGGSGGTLVAVGIGQLVGVSETAGTPNEAYEEIITSTNQTVSGPATDVATGLPFTGVFMAPSVSLVSGELPAITAVSTLVTYLLRAEDPPNNNPTAQDIIDKANEIFNAFNVGSEDVEPLDAASTVEFFAGGDDLLNLPQDSLNHQLYSLIATVGSQAALNGQDAGDAINAFLEALANAIENGEITPPIDLSDIDSLTDLFDAPSFDDFQTNFFELGVPQIDAIVEAVTTGGETSGAVIFFEPNENTIATTTTLGGVVTTVTADDDGFALTIVGNEVPVSDVAVIASLGGLAGSNDVSVTVEDAAFVNSSINVETNADGQDASLFLAGVEYDDDVTNFAFEDISIRSFANSSDAEAELNVDGRVAGDVEVLAYGNDTRAALYIAPNSSLDTSVEFLGGSLDVDAIGADVEAGLIIQGATGELGSITINAQNISDDSYAIAYAIVDLEEGNVNGDITISSESSGDAVNDEASVASAIGYFGIGGDLSGDVDVTTYNSGSAYVDSEYNEAYAITVSGVYMGVSGDVNGDISLSATNVDGSYVSDVYDTDAYTAAYTIGYVGISGDMNGSITLDAVNDGYANVVGDSSDSSNAYTHAYTLAYVTIGGDMEGDITLNATNASYANVDVIADSQDANADAYSSAYALIAVGGDLSGDVSISATNYYDGDASASGVDSNAEAYAEAYAIISVGGDLDGSITIAADNSGDADVVDGLYLNADAFAFAGVDLEVSGDVNGNISISAINSGVATTGESADSYSDSDAYAYTDSDISIGGDLSGDISVSAQNYGNALATDTSDYINGDTDASAYVDADTNISIDGDMTGNIAITAYNSGDATALNVNDTSVYADAYAGADIYIDDDLNGNIAINATNTGSAYVGSSSDYAYTYAYAEAAADIQVGGDLIGNVEVNAVNYGDSVVADITDDSDSDVYASAVIDLDVDGDLIGTITGASINNGSADVSGDDGYTYVGADTEMNVSVYGSVSGDVDISATNNGIADSDFADNVESVTYSDVTLDLYVSNDLDGDLTISSTNNANATVSDGSYVSAYAIAYAGAYVDVSGDVNGNINLTATNNGNAYVGDSSDYSGAYSYAETYADIRVGGDLSGDVSVSAFNNGTATTDSDGYDDAYARSYAINELDLEVGGNMYGNITVDAVNNAGAYATEGSDNSGAIAYVDSDAYIQIDGNLVGDITITADNYGTAQVADSSDYTDADTDADATADITVVGNVSGDITVEANNYGDATVAFDSEYSYAEADAQVNLYLNVSGDVNGNISVSAYNSGDATVDDAYESDGATDAQAFFVADISGDVNGDITVNALNTGDATTIGSAYYSQVDATAYASMYMNVGGDVSGDIIGNIDISATNSGNAVAEDGDVYADVVDGIYSYADAYVHGNHVETYAQTEVNIDVDGNISGDITIAVNNSGDASITDSEYSAVYVRAYADVDINVGGSVSGDVTISANNSGDVDIAGSEYSIGYAYSYVYAYISIGEDLTGDITIDAVNTGDTVVELLSDWSYAVTYARVYSDIDVGGNVSGDLTFTALNEGNAFAGNVSDNSYATSVTYALNYSHVSVLGDFNGDITLTSNNKGDVVNFGGVNVATWAVVDSVVYVQDQVNIENIALSATNEGSEGFAGSYLDLTAGSGDIANVTLNASDITEDLSGEADIYFGLNDDTSRFNGAIGNMDVSIGNNGTVSVDVSLTEYIDTLNIEADDITGSGLVDVYVDQGQHGGDVYINNYGDTATDFWLTYEDATADRIYLGSYLDNNVLTAGEFDGSFLNLELRMDNRDLSLDDFTDYTQLVNEMLSIYGAYYDEMESNFELYFENITDSGYEQGMSAYANLNQFLNAADAELDGTTDYYFGVVGNDGYLAYDQDGDGLTMLIQFDDLTTFSSSLITNTITP